MPPPGIDPETHNHSTVCMLPLHHRGISKSAAVVRLLYLTHSFVLYQTLYANLTSSVFMSPH